MLRGRDDAQAAAEHRQQVDQDRVAAGAVRREPDRMAAEGEVEVRPRITEEGRRLVGDRDRHAHGGGNGQHHEERPVGAQERPHEPVKPSRRRCGSS
jgi:hypothetical protein